MNVQVSSRPLGEIRTDALVVGLHADSRGLPPRWPRSTGAPGAS